MNFQPDDSIGDYKIIRELGEGTFGQVYLAEWQTRKGVQQGALKLLKKQKDKTLEQEFAEILDEVATWGRVSQHENVVTFLGAKRHQGQFLMLSEYVAGGALDDWLKGNGGKSPSLEIAVKLMLGILAGLAHLHDNDIIHRDVKPANIMLKGETPLLVDFGLARGLDLAQSSILAGSMIYMPPELIEAWLNQMPGQKVERNEQHDLWPAAVTFQEVLTGRRPFETTGQILQAAPRPLPANFPAKWQAIMNRAFAKDPAQRYQTAAQMSAAIHEAFYGPLVETQPAPLINAKRSQIFEAMIRAARSETQPTPPTTVLPPKKITPYPVQPALVTPDVLRMPQTFTNRVGMEFALIEPGEFIMGSEDYDTEKPVHRVRLAYPFYMGKYQVTQAQWRAVLSVALKPHFKGDNLPMESVSWHDAQAFVKELNNSDKNYLYRLPSEAEWEYTARAGTKTAFAFGDSLSSKEANFNGNYPYGEAAKGEYKEKTTPVGSYQPNAWGLYDMHGNVWEWCEDIYQDNYKGLPTDGSANVSVGDSTSRVLRGGSWYDVGLYCRSAFRFRLAPDLRDRSIGLRLVAVART